MFAKFEQVRYPAVNRGLFISFLPDVTSNFDHFVSLPTVTSKQTSATRLLCLCFSLAQ